jgi:dolichyl-phosphate-mannose-protein mannosyltransferase
MTWREATGLGLLLAIGLGLRLVLLDVDGHAGDVRVMLGWAERMADAGPGGFYDDRSSLYPALLYPLWLLGSLLDGEALRLAVKGLSIPFDAVLGVLLYVLVRSSGPLPALAASALYLLNPATLLAGPVWGQVDSAGTLACVASLGALASRRHGLAGGLSAVAGLLKPQFGFAALVVLVVALLEWRRAGTTRPLAAALLGMVLVTVMVAAPLALDPLRYMGILEATAVRHPETSLHAFNAWGLLVGFGVPDDPYVGIGGVLLVVGIAGAITGLRRRPDLAVVLGVGAVLALAFYFLPTRIHERYLFPAVALLAPFAVTGGVQLAAYAAISAAFAASLLYTLHETTAFTLPAGVAAWLVTPVGVWAIGLVLIASALAWSWMLVVRRPPWRPAHPVREA